MTKLTDLRDYAEAHRHFSKEKLWELFAGGRERFNIGHECIDRHPPERAALRIAFSDGRR